MEPCPCHFKFFLRRLAHLRILSWLSLRLALVDASNFGGMAHAHKHFTCMVVVEREVVFLSPGVAELWLTWTFSGPLLGPSLGWSQRGQGHGAQLRCGAANGLA